MNSKKTILAIVGVAVLWFLMDFVIHGVLLMDTYKATSQLWRAPEEMNQLTSMIVTFVFSALYVLFYTMISSSKTVAQGFKFGFWYGLLSGLGMFSTSIYMPIPMNIALSWFAACFVESMLAGTLMGYITKE